MGVAGSGKSTQGRQLADDYGYAYLSTGDVFRVLITGRRRNEMLEGRLLSDTEVIDMIDKVLQLIDTKEQFILDGFPRTKVQVNWLEKQFEAGRFDGVPEVINLEVAEKTVHDRLSKRGRLDDNEEAVSRRYDEYEHTTRPILTYMREKGWKVTDVDADRSTPAVYKDILKALKPGN